LLFTARQHVKLRFTVKHEKTEDEDENETETEDEDENEDEDEGETETEDENEDEGCRLIPTTHWLPATDYYLLPTSEPGFALYAAGGRRIDSLGGDAARPPFRVPGSGFRLSPGSGL
jgi:hypothetical protein